MSAWSVVVDPVSEAPENIELELVGTDPGVDPYFMLDLDIPDAEHDPLVASTPDMDGDLLIANRQKTQTITCIVRATGADASALMPVGGTLQRAIGKHHAEGGTLAIQPPDGDRVIFDVQDAEMDPSTGIDVGVGRTTVECRFHCLPGARGTEYLTDSVSSGGSPVCRATIPDIPGDLQALVRLIATDGANSRQLSFMWGQRQKFYDSAASAALFFEAEALTNLGTSADAARTGASGGNVVRNTGLSTAWQSILSTQIGGGSHMSHVGSYRVRARVYDPSTVQGQVQLRLSWSEGDFFVWTDNFAVEPPIKDAYSIVDLGTVRLRKTKSGTQQWQGQIHAKTQDATLTDKTVDVDYLWLEPIDEGSGRLLVTQNLSMPSAGLTASDEFNQAAGALTGEALPMGGNWTELPGSDADDFQNVSGGLVSRASVSDAGSIGHYLVGRGVYASGPSPSLVFAQVDMMFDVMPTSAIYQSLLLRIVDGANVAAFRFGYSNGSGGIGAFRVIGGFQVSGNGRSVGSVSAAVWYTLSVLIEAGGAYSYWFDARGAALSSVPVTGSFSDFPASGKVGIGDRNATSQAVTRYFDNFRVWVPTVDAAIFSGQSLEVRHDLAQREDSGGSIWAPRPDYQGDYCTVAPAGNEGRVAEVIAKASRGNIETGADSAIDSLSLQFAITPRFRNVFTGIGVPSGFPAYSLTNVTTRQSYNANNVTLDVLADFLATLIRDIPLPIATYSVTNLTTDRVYNANATTLNELADVLGTLAAELALPGPHPTFAPSNVTVRRSMDCNNVSVDQLADVLGTFINDLIAVGDL